MFFLLISYRDSVALTLKEDHTTKDNFLRGLWDSSICYHDVYAYRDATKYSVSMLEV